MNKRKVFSFVCSILTLVFCVSISKPIKSNAIGYGHFLSSDGLWEYGCGGIFKYFGTEKTVTLPETVDEMKIIRVDLSEDNTIENLIIPRSYTCFRYCAFEKCKKLKTVIFSREYSEGEITEFQAALFLNCKKLKKVVLPNILPKNNFNELKLHVSPNKYRHEDDYAATLGSDIFKNCKNLKEIILPDNLEQIQYGAFENCASLEYLEFPSKVKYLFSGLFDGCVSLKTIKLSNALQFGSDTNPFFVAQTNSSPTLILDSNCEYIDSIKETENLNVLIQHPEIEVKGDIDGNEECNIQDVTYLQKILADFFHFDLPDRADTNNDGKININDATCIQRMIVKLI